MKPMPRFLLFMLLFAASRLWAADIDKEFQEASWAEGNVQLPKLPLEENLIPFRVGSGDRHGVFHRRQHDFLSGPTGCPLFAGDHQQQWRKKHQLRGCAV